MKLESGVELDITIGSFDECNDLFKAVMREAKDLEISMLTDDAAVFKNAITIALSSDSIEQCVWALAKRCTYGGRKVTKELFADEKAREDYLAVMFEIAKANLRPFMKHLYAKFSHRLGALNSLA